MCLCVFQCDGLCVVGCFCCCVFVLVFGCDCSMSVDAVCELLCDGVWCSMCCCLCVFV